MGTGDCDATCNCSGASEAAGFDLDMQLDAYLNGVGGPGEGDACDVPACGAPPAGQKYFCPESVGLSGMGMGSFALVEEEVRLLCGGRDTPFFQKCSIVITLTFTADNSQAVANVCRGCTLPL